MSEAPHPCFSWYLASREETAQRAADAFTAQGEGRAAYVDKIGGRRRGYVVCCEHMGARWTLLQTEAQALGVVK